VTVIPDIRYSGSPYWSKG